jgi:hypothetical protein
LGEKEKILELLDITGKLRRNYGVISSNYCQIRSNEQYYGVITEKFDVITVNYGVMSSNAVITVFWGKVIQKCSNYSVI